MNKPKESLLLVDGNALIHRGFHALPNLTNRDGQPTGAIFGFTRLLLAALKIIKPEYVAVAFDSRGKTFRHHMYQDYKATRKKGPDELYEQVPLVHEIVKSMNIPTYIVPGFEADDIIGTLSKQANSKNLTTTILTGDMDLVQLVNSDTSLFAPQKGVSNPAIYTPKTVRQKYGFDPDKMVFFKSLRGDASDNIPGVPGVGEVSAKKIVAKFDTLKELYTYLNKGKKIPDLGVSIHQKLRANQDQAKMSFELATIVQDVPVTLRKEDCVTHEFDRDKVVDIFVKLGFRSMLKELPGKPQVGEVDEEAINQLFQQEQVPVAENALNSKLRPILREVEKKGVLLDVAYLNKLNSKWEAELVTEQLCIHKLAGVKFNVDSSRQLADILFNTLKLPTKGIKKIQSGWSTDAAQLEVLEPVSPIIKHVIVYRELAKLINTYTKPLVKLVDQESRLHTTYAADTATGRLSSKDPNLQNIPIRTERGAKIRQAFIAKEDHTLIAADYSQIELRVAAHLAKDPVMIAAFRAGKDIHDATSKEMGVDRRVAKIINFSILYGKGAHGFANDLNISIDEAKEYIDRYFKTYKGIDRWINETLRFVSNNGYTQTMFGFKRPFPSLKGHPAHRYSRLGREAINTPVQGSAAEILKRAMIAIADEPKLKDAMVLTVHDELVFEVPSSQVAKVKPLIKKIMENTTTLDVPVLVEIHSGKSWGKMKE